MFQDHTFVGHSPNWRKSLYQSPWFFEMFQDHTFVGHSPNWRKVYIISLRFRDVWNWGLHCKDLSWGTAPRIAPYLILKWWLSWVKTWAQSCTKVGTGTLPPCLDPPPLPALPVLPLLPVLPVLPLQPLWPSLLSLPFAFGLGNVTMGPCCDEHLFNSCVNWGPNGASSCSKTPWRSQSHLQQPGSHHAKMAGWLMVSRSHIHTHISIYIYIKYIYILCIYIYYVYI